MQLIKTINIEELKSIGVLNDDAKEIADGSLAGHNPNGIYRKMQRITDKIKKQKFDYGIFLINDKYLANKLNKGQKFCGIPLCCPISEYEEYLEDLYALGQYNSEVSFYNGTRVVKDVVSKVQPLIMNTTHCTIIEVSSQNIRVLLDIREDAVTKLIRECSSLVGFDMIKEHLNSMNVADLVLNDQISISRKDVYKNSYGTIVY